MNKNLPPGPQSITTKNTKPVLPPRTTQPNSINPSHYLKPRSVSMPSKYTPLRANQPPGPLLPPISSHFNPPIPNRKYQRSFEAQFSDTSTHPKNPGYSVGPLKSYHQTEPMPSTKSYSALAPGPLKSYHQTEPMPSTKSYSVVAPVPLKSYHQTEPIPSAKNFPSHHWNSSSGQFGNQGR